MTGEVSDARIPRVTDFPEGPSHPDLRELVQTVWRHWFLLLAAALAFSGLAVALGRALPPHFAAQGILHIDNKEVTVPELQTVRASESSSPWVARSEVAVLTSRELIEAAVRSLGLAADPAFNPDLRPSLLGRLRELFPALSRRRAMLTAGIRSTAPPPAPETVTAEAIQADLVAYSEERSLTIVLQYLGRAPDRPPRS